MATRAEWLALAARVEAATGVDRKLDAAIAQAAGWQDVHAWAVDDSYVGGRPPGSADWLYVPSFTYSLDAAAALASNWLIAAWGDLVADGLPGAVVILSTDDPVRDATGIGAGTRESGAFARALTAAACRAMAEEAENE